MGGWEAGKLEGCGVGGWELGRWEAGRLGGWEVGRWETGRLGGGRLAGDLQIPPNFMVPKNDPRGPFDN